MFNDIYKQIDGITNWMKKYLDESEANGYVIGLSGGVDSSVVAALAVKAVGAEKVHGVIMPIGSDSNDEGDAVLISEKLGIARHLISLRNVCTDMVNNYPDIIHHDLLFLANIKARLRMTMLYAVAGEKSYLVAGTSNKTELEIGYFTKYGDGAVDIEPIADFYKTEIFDMAYRLRVPNRIIDKDPSAGLWKGQRDEDDIGMTYDKLDNILMFLNAVDGVRLNATKEEVKYVLDIISKNEHKIKPIPKYKRLWK